MREPQFDVLEALLYVIMALSKRALALQTSKLAQWIRGNPAQSVAPQSAPIQQLSSPSSSLILYDYEASPWCRLVREYLTILDLTVTIRPCPRQTLWSEGAYTAASRFRPQAMKALQQRRQRKSDNGDNNNNTNDERIDLMFPILVDYQGFESKSNEPVVIQQSYNILEHLWHNYGQTVLPTTPPLQRQDQRVNANDIAFIRRFLSLAAPSYLRPWPSCGVLRLENTWEKKVRKDDDCNTDPPLRNENSSVDSSSPLILYQSEGCPASKLVRECLCSLEIPYISVPVAKGSQNVVRLANAIGQEMNTLSDANKIQLPVLTIGRYGLVMQGHDDCIDYLLDQYLDHNAPRPSWFDTIPSAQNLGHDVDEGETQKPRSLLGGAYTAFLQGSRAFVPPQTFY